MASKTEGMNRYYYLDGKVVYPYDAGTPSSDCVFAYFKDPDHFPIAKPRFASTVMLVREGVREACDGNTAAPAHPQVFMLHRVGSMAFAADAFVFPGGRLDEADYEAPERWQGPSPGEWARVLGVDENVARAAVVAAVRETFEECGVFLASDGGGNIGRMSESYDEGDRSVLSSHSASLAEVLSRRKMTLRSDLLHARARWITPVAEPRRYDTFFFSALVPEGVMPDGDTSEADGFRWVEPAGILERFDRDEALLLPPTIHQLIQLQAAPSAASFAAQPPHTEPVLCESAILQGKAVAICPKA